MTVSVTLPALGESVTEGTVTRWLKQVGETVRADEPLLEISTDKVDTEIPSPASGVLLEIVVDENETAEVGARLAVIGSPAPTGPATTKPDVPSPPEPVSVAPAPPDTAPTPAYAPVPSPQEEVPATPPVRRSAAEPEVGPVSSAAVTEAPRENTPELTSRRGRPVRMPLAHKILGESLKKALRDQAQLTTVIEADVTGLNLLRNRAEGSFAAREGFGLTALPFFVLAAAQALKTHPVVNARFNAADGTVTYFDTENIGIAVDTDKGLVTLVVKEAGELTVTGVARAIVELTAKAHRGGLTPDDVSGATFTVFDTGSHGALFDTVIVPPNQAAVLGIGATVPRPRVVESAVGPTVGIREVVYLTLSYDHRLIDGADAARYLTAVKAIMETAAFADELP